MLTGYLFTIGNLWSQAVAPPGGVPPKDYFVMSILTLLFCFWPLGIVALIKSIEVRKLSNCVQSSCAQYFKLHWFETL